MKKQFQHFILLSCLLVASFSAEAQFSEAISADRPGQAFSPNTVGNLVFQTQTGIDGGGFKEKEVDYQAQEKGSFFIPNTFLRFGLREHFEINSAWAYSLNKDMVGDTSSFSNGLALATIGARINIFEGRDKIPAIGMLVTFKLPILSPTFQQEFVAPIVVVMAGNKITDKFSILLNFGMDFNGDNAQPNWTYVANLSYSISPKVGAFIENYGHFNGNDFWNSWDTGLSYLVNNNLQLDIYGGAGYNQNTLDYFASIGFSWRLVTMYEKAKQKQ